MGQDRAEEQRPQEGWLVEAVHQWSSRLKEVSLQLRHVYVKAWIIDQGLLFGSVTGAEEAWVTMTSNIIACGGLPSQLCKTSATWGLGDSRCSSKPCR